jgi:hypothetical protein
VVLMPSLSISGAWYCGVLQAERPRAVDAGEDREGMAQPARYMHCALGSEAEVRRAPRTGPRGALTRFADVRVAL